MEIDKRLTLLLSLLGLSPAEFADRINVQRSSISHITSGRNKPSLLFIENTLNAFPEINSEWLILGKGKPFKEEYLPVSDHALPSQELLNQEETIPPIPPKITEEEPSLFPMKESLEMDFPFEEKSIEQPQIEEKKEEIRSTASYEEKSTLFPSENKEKENSQSATKEDSSPRGNEIKKIIIFNKNGSFEVYEND